MRQAGMIPTHGRGADGAAPSICFINNPLLFLLEKGGTPVPLSEVEGLPPLGAWRAHRWAHETRQLPQIKGLGSIWTSRFSGAIFAL